MEHRTIKETILKGLLAFLLALPAVAGLKAQNLEELLNQRTEHEESVNYVNGTFKGTRVVTGHSCEVTQRGDLMFLVSHRFGTLNSGFYNFYGLDNATTRIGFEYGLYDRLALGIARSTFEKTYDGFLKYQLLKQSTGKKVMPLTVTAFTSFNLKTLDPADPEKEYTLANKLAYTYQLLIGRKLGPKLSLQLAPTYIHKNLVPTKTDQNDLAALGAAGRYKLTNRFSLNMEYFYLMPGTSADNFDNAFSLGVDIETGGHIFQLMLTNARAMFERSFITETSGNWMNGDIHFGFNITRVFHVGGF